MTILFTDETGEVLARYDGVSKAKRKRVEELLGTSPSKKAVRFVPPTVEEVRAYCAERGNRVDPERFVDHYAASGWKRNRGVPLIDWKAAVRNWEKNDFAGDCKKEKPKSELPQSFDVAELEKRAGKRYLKKGGAENAGKIPDHRGG